MSFGIGEGGYPLDYIREAEDRHLAEELEAPGDDLCDVCGTSQVHANRTAYCGKVIGIECGCDEALGATCGDSGCEVCARTSARPEVAG